MNIEETEERILVAILALRKETDKKKLKISDVAKRANISRNALYRYYADLLPVIKEGKNTEKFKHISRDKLAKQEQISGANLAAELAENELSTLRASLNDERNKFKNEILGEYMERLIVTENSDRVENDMEGMQIQLSDRIADLKNIKIEKAKLSSKVAKLTDELNAYRTSGSTKVIKKLFEPDFRSATEDYNETGDWDAWLRSKKTLTRATITKAIDDTKDSDGVVIILTSYNASPEIIMNEHCMTSGKYTYIHLSIPTATERKRYITEIKKKTGLKVFAITTISSASNSKWYRRTTTPSVSNDEIIDVESRWQAPLNSEGYSSILSLEIAYA